MSIWKFLIRSFWPDVKSNLVKDWTINTFISPGKINLLYLEVANVLGAKIKDFERALKNLLQFNRIFTEKLSNIFWKHFILIWLRKILSSYINHHVIGFQMYSFRIRSQCYNTYTCMCFITFATHVEWITLWKYRLLKFVHCIKKFSETLTLKRVVAWMKVAMFYIRWYGKQYRSIRSVHSARHLHFCE